jgi:hypothetical protein
VPHWISCRKGQTPRNLVLTGLYYCYIDKELQDKNLVITGLYYFYLDKELQDKKCLTGYLVERVRHGGNDGRHQKVGVGMENAWLVSRQQHLHKGG